MTRQERKRAEQSKHEINQMSNGRAIIQWNCQGIKAKKDELLKIIEAYRPEVVAVQETMIRDSEQFRIPQYKERRREGHYNRRSHGGVAISVHEETPHRNVQVNTPVQAVAIRVTMGRPVTICSIYIPGSQEISVQLLESIYQQLPEPVMLLGDFNAHSERWGSDGHDARGRVVEEFVDRAGLNILNTGRPTHIAETAIDLSIATPRIEIDVEWGVFSSARASDHFPILIKVPDGTQEARRAVARNYKRADWKLYKECNIWNNVLDAEAEDARTLVDDLYEKLEAAAEIAIPSTERNNKFYPKPWWSSTLTESYKARERAYHAWRRRKSPQNRIQWKKMQALHRRAVKKHKKDSWEEMAAQVNKNTPMRQVWEIVRKVKGKEPRKIPILEENGQEYTNVQDISDKLADTFERTSSSDNYSEQFKRIKERREQKEIDFKSNNKEVYNKVFKMHELRGVIQKLKNTAPGPDEICNRMIQNLPEAAIEYLLAVLNACYRESYCPEKWRLSTVIPIPKPNKKDSDPLNYRPISLTSVLCKIMERLINRRLLDYLERVPEFARLQTGGLEGRSCEDQLVRLENVVRTGFAKEQHTVSVFFDMEKAYDRTWKYGILEDM